MSEHPTHTRFAVVMAGGSGERFWPLSRRLRPKQLLKLTHPERTMLHEAVDRMATLIARDAVYIVTGTHLAEPIRRGETGVPPENVLAEPHKRNTSGALAYAAAHILAQTGSTTGEGLTMAVLTADHLIDPPERFREVVAAALDAAEQQSALATIGIMPTRPETGYGYIQVNPEVPPTVGVSDVPVYTVRAFLEKPDRKRAEAFFADGNYYWNSGMFFWTLDAFLRELEGAKPELAEAVHSMAAAMRAGDTGKVGRIFEGLENISIDYALMERASKVVVAGADFTWDDVGAWTALERTQSKDTHSNVAIGDPILVDTRRSIIYNDAGAEDMAVAVVGMEDVVVVVAGDAVLVMPKDRAQDVRAVVEALKQRKAAQL